VSPPSDHRLDELFVRYWDNALTGAEAAELEQRLAADPLAREWFQLLCLQAVVTAELPAVTAPPAPRGRAGAAGRIGSPSPAEPARPPRRWSRRRVLGYLGGGLAACVVAGVLGRRYRSAPPAAPVRLRATHGAVTLQTASGQTVPLTDFVPPGGTVSTHGPNSSAVLSYADGTGVAFNGDSVVTVAGHGRRLVLHQGTATADVPPQPAGADLLTLATTEATLTGLSGVLMTLGRLLRATEVGVHHGLVTVATPTGEPLEVVRGGELLTIRAGGDRCKQQLPATPDQFAWDLTRPLPDDWHVGYRELTPDGPVVRPEFWFDPYHQAEMSQIRSDKQWSRGFFRLFPESVLRVRYWVDRPGPSQVVICVRTGRRADPATGVVECNGAFAQARPREWQWLEVKAQDMLDNIHTPRFAAPWVGFLVIFNTYQTDLGLRVADFRVTRPGGPAAGA
jgi:ferric-dicitrate binding protein FerR (iron transport regulator)